MAKISLRELIIYYDLKHAPMSGGPGFPLREDQIIHAGPIKDKVVGPGVEHEFYAIAMKITGLTGHLQLFHRTNLTYYSFDSSPKFEIAKMNGGTTPDHDWDLTIYLKIDDQGPQDITFKLPVDIDFSNKPRIDIDVEVAGQIGNRALHGICRVYVKNA